MRLRVTFWVMYAVPIVLLSCMTKQGGEEQTTGSDEKVSEAYVVEVKTTSMEFQAPDTIKSGWVTISYTNSSPMVHLALLDKMPEGMTVKEHQDTVGPLFQNIMDQINGRELSEPGVGTTPPAWMADIVYTGGPGLLSSGKTCETTMYLTPGIYVLECYIKTNKVFHSYNPDPRVYGMVHQFVVTDDLADAMEPKPAMTIDIGTEQGLVVNGDPQPGPQVMAVNYIDQKVYPNFIQHDVHIVKNIGGDIDSLLTWINWMEPRGLETPAPNGFTFMGGIHEMPAGSTGYVNINFEPGEYIFLSEVPRADTFGLMKILTVGDGQ